MKHHKRFSHLFQGLLPILVCLVAIGGLLVGAQPAVAQLPPDNGPTQTGEICMQKVFGTPVTNSNRLNCTANDIRISGVAIDENGDAKVSPTQCFEGVNFDLTATFLINVTANARYDAGFFFRIDGGANARGDGTNATGECSLSALDPTLNLAPTLNLDGDTCGDLNAGQYEVTFTIPDVACVGVPDPTDPTGERKILRLPNCTSWHSNQATACNIEDPFTFDPDTKSKCVCDDTFTVPVIVAAPEGDVVKSATQAVVTYAVTVVNTSTTTPVTVELLDDSLYGNITHDKNTPAPDTNTAIERTDCATGATLAIGDGTSGGPDTYTCTFDVKYLNPGTVGNKSNIVSARLKSTLSDQESTFTGSTTINLDLDVDTTP